RLRERRMWQGTDAEKQRPAPVTARALQALGRSDWRIDAGPIEPDLVDRVEQQRGAAGGDVEADLARGADRLQRDRAAGAAEEDVGADAGADRCLCCGAEIQAAERTVVIAGGR